MKLDKLSPHVRLVAEFCQAHSEQDLISLEEMTVGTAMPVSLVRAGVLICERLGLLEAVGNNSYRITIENDAVLRTRVEDKPRSDSKVSPDVTQDTKAQEAALNIHRLEVENRMQAKSIEQLERKNKELIAQVSRLRSKVATILKIAAEEE